MTTRDRWALVDGEVLTVEPEDKAPEELQEQVLAAADAADIVTLTVPFAHQASTLELVKPALQGKILIDVTVPLVPPKVARVQLPESGSAGQIAQELLGEEVAVVTLKRTNPQAVQESLSSLFGDIRERHGGAFGQNDWFVIFQSLKRSSHF